jgi:hypothetical protein
MSGRIEQLEARRRALLHQCEEQRLELAYRVAQIRPAAALTAWTKRTGAKSAANHPLALIAGIAGIVMMLFRRRRRVMSGVGEVGLITGLVALASRATTILRVVAQLRAVYLGLMAARRPPPP